MGRGEPRRRRRRQQVAPAPGTLLGSCPWPPYPTGSLLQWEVRVSQHPPPTSPSRRVLGLVSGRSYLPGPASGQSLPIPFLDTCPHPQLTTTGQSLLCVRGQQRGGCTGFICEAPLLLRWRQLSAPRIAKAPTEAGSCRSSPGEPHGSGSREHFRIWGERHVCPNTLPAGDPGPLTSPSGA